VSPPHFAGGHASSSNKLGRRYRAGPAAGYPASRQRYRHRSNLHGQLAARTARRRLSRAKRLTERRAALLVARSRGAILFVLAAGSSAGSGGAPFLAQDCDGSGVDRGDAHSLGASFWVSIYLVGSNAPFAFFTTIGRTWELTVKQSHPIRAKLEKTRWMKDLKVRSSGCSKPNNIRLHRMTFSMEYQTTYALSSPANRSICSDFCADSPLTTRCSSSVR
jgi:hypothetical protein